MNTPYTAAAIAAYDLAASAIADTLAAALRPANQAVEDAWAAARTAQDAAWEKYQRDVKNSKDQKPTILPAPQHHNTPISPLTPAAATLEALKAATAAFDTACVTVEAATRAASRAITYAYADGFGDFTTGNPDQAIARLASQCSRLAAAIDALEN